MLEDLIRGQLDQAAIVGKEPTAFGEDPSKSARRWELIIPRFVGPNDNVAPVLTSWALNPGDARPHLTTAYPITV